MGSSPAIMTTKVRPDSPVALDILRALARSLTANFKLPLKWGESSCTDGNTIWIRPKLPYLSESKETWPVWFETLRGITAHEAFHILWSDFKAWERYLQDPDLTGYFHPEVIRGIGNSSEDARIELAGANAFPGTHNWLRTANLMAVAAYRVPKDRVAALLMGYVAYAVAGTLPRGYAEAWPEWVDWLDSVSDKMEQARQARTNAEALAICKEIVLTLKDHLPRYQKPEGDTGLRPEDILKGLRGNPTSGDTSGGDPRLKIRLKVRMPAGASAGGAESSPGEGGKEGASAQAGGKPGAGQGQPAGKSGSAGGQAGSPSGSGASGAKAQGAPGKDKGAAGPDSGSAGEPGTGKSGGGSSGETQAGAGASGKDEPGGAAAGSDEAGQGATGSAPSDSSGSAEAGRGDGTEGPGGQGTRSGGSGGDGAEERGDGEADVEMEVDYDDLPEELKEALRTYEAIRGAEEDATEGDGSEAGPASEAGDEPESGPETGAGEEDEAEPADGESAGGDAHPDHHSRPDPTGHGHQDADSGSLNGAPGGGHGATNDGVTMDSVEEPDPEEILRELIRIAETSATEALREDPIVLDEFDGFDPGSAARSVSGKVACHAGVRFKLEDPEPQVEVYQAARRMVAEVEPLLKTALKPLVAREASEMLGGLRRGSLDTARLWRVPALHDPKVMCNRRIPYNPALAVSLLLDSSGSMGSLTTVGGREMRRDDAVRLATVALTDVLEELGIPHAVTAFDADGHSVSSSIVTHRRLLRFGQKNNRESVVNFKARHSNRDGYSIRVVAEELKRRKEPVKMLMVLSDGQPASGGGYDSASTAATGVVDTALAVREAQAMGINVIGFYFGERDPHHLKIEVTMFGTDRLVVVSDLMTLPQDMAVVLKRIGSRFRN